MRTKVENIAVWTVALIVLLSVVVPMLVGAANNLHVAGLS